MEVIPATCEELVKEREKPLVKVVEKFLSSVPSR